MTVYKMQRVYNIVRSIYFLHCEIDEDLCDSTLGLQRTMDFIRCTRVHLVVLLRSELIPGANMSAVFRQWHDTSAKTFGQASAGRVR